MANKHFQVGWAQDQLISAGASASGAYQKATFMWQQKQKRPAGPSPGQDTDNATVKSAQDGLGNLSVQDQKSMI
jgi:hypothetical protein